MQVSKKVAHLAFLGAFTVFGMGMSGCNGIGADLANDKELQSEIAAEAADAGR